MAFNFNDFLTQLAAVKQQSAAQDQAAPPYQPNLSNPGFDQGYNAVDNAGPPYTMAGFNKGYNAVDDALPALGKWLIKDITAPSTKQAAAAAATESHDTPIAANQPQEGFFSRMGGWLKGNILDQLPGHPMFGGSSTPVSGPSTPAEQMDKAVTDQQKSEKDQTLRASAQAKVQGGQTPTSDETARIVADVSISKLREQGIPLTDQHEAELEAHAKQFVDSLDDHKKIDLLSAGLGILSGMGRNKNVANVIGAGLTEGMLTAGKDRQERLNNILNARKVQVDQQGADANTMNAETNRANSNLEQRSQDIQQRGQDITRRTAIDVARINASAELSAAQVHAMAVHAGNQNITDSDIKFTQGIFKQFGLNTPDGSTDEEFASAFTPLAKQAREAGYSNEDIIKVIGAQMKGGGGKFQINHDWVGPNHIDIDRSDRMLNDINNFVKRAGAGPQ